ncbi:hypothetical protein [Flavobacterium sp. UMI-01]|uniref:hypothetical protein n=1 Tax=Flavobacterium sp. UMI-01 TaxID=1441053 RepID=UPI001C7D68CD|nr:hypothetical protein [Flavobacterium sp. UMI-01]GIZ08346.1 hypothetical protein FUMI01_10730 [Flavobacterium sp. UMI-01]
MKIEEIISVVEVTLSVDLNDFRRTNTLVDARIVVSIIALNLGYTLTEIAKSLNKTHCTIFYYRELFKHYKNDKNFRPKFLSCIKAFEDYAETNVYIDDSNLIEELKIRKRNLEKRLEQINQVLEGK